MVRVVPPASHDHDHRVPQGEEVPPGGRPEPELAEENGAPAGAVARPIVAGLRHRWPPGSSQDELLVRVVRQQFPEEEEALHRQLGGATSGSAAAREPGAPAQRPPASRLGAVPRPPSEYYYLASISLVAAIYAVNSAVASHTI